jgi:glycine/D-amino acid oxidase-like deaminating enzyme
MQCEIIIIGQGISGTFLSHYLQKAGLAFVVIDEAKLNTASRTAAGIINPVTGRRIVKTWMIDELMAFAKNAYGEIGLSSGMECIVEKKIIDFFPTPQMRHAFVERYDENKEYLGLPEHQNEWSKQFNYEFGYGEIAPVFLVDVAGLLGAYRKNLSEKGLLIEEHFTIDDLSIAENRIQYKDIIAGKIIFCDGIESFTNPYFKNLPFAPNKGEALILEIEDFPDQCIFKKGMNIVPLKNSLFWVGSSYEWEFENELPNTFFRERTELILLDWLNTPFKIIGHVASIRPATLERRPFVGFHPLYKNVGILNGMGTKGCSLAPFFANQLTQHIIDLSPLLPEADVMRFERALKR